MFKKIVIILITILLTSAQVSAYENINIEIFDINKECVVKKVHSNPAIQKEVELYLKGITDIYTKFNPIPNKGYMIKIPLEVPIAVQNKWISTFVDEVIIIVPEGQGRYLMVFDNKDRALFFTFEGNVDVLLKSLHFRLKNH